jgi:glycosyltransferase involved in cell wall biosynthesis
MKTTDHPDISVVICTRDRGGAVAGTVISLLNNDYSAYELIVLDQSRDDLTEQSIEAFRGDGRFRYLRSREIGLSRGRNRGVTETQGKIIAFTDDDCDVPSDWIESIARAFCLDAKVLLVFGSVTAAAHDSAKGFIPCYEVKKPFVARSVHDKNHIDGMGACMALRRSLWEELSGFDLCLGPGSPLRSADENDFVLRTLIAGHWVYETPSICVRHRGFRPWEENDSLVSGYLLGTGAMFAKHLRLNHKGMLPLLARILWRWIFKRPLVWYSSSPKRILRLVSFCRGWLEGMKMPIDRRTLHYKPGREPPDG